MAVNPQRSAEERVSSLAVVEATDADAAAWNGFVAAAPDGELYHDYRWRPLIGEVFGHESVYLMAREGNGRVRGVLPLVRLRSRLFGDFMVSLPYFNYGGILADSPAATHALADAAGTCAQRLGVAHVELRHRARVALDWPAREDKVTMVLELPSSSDELMKGLGSKLRSQVRRPQKAGATARLGRLELLDDFYSVFSRNMRDLGTPVYPRRLFRSILETFGVEAKLAVIDLGGKAVAAGLVLTHGSTMEIPWASSLREANRSSVNMLLYWAVLEAAIAEGCTRFDFGRSSKDSGTYRFKEQWGAKPEQLLWHYWLPEGRELPKLTPSNPKYQLAIAVWKKLPLPVANLLGPHIVKSLP
jgi:FemAB-related protein (PEP-CTERM system-associated)